MAAQNSLELSALCVYPVKSCRGIPLTTGVVSATGLLFDRNWVIVKEAGGRFLTQRQVPKLALVEVAIVPGELLQGADLAACPDAQLVLRAPGMPNELRVPLAAPLASKPLIQVTVWEWTGMAADEGDEAARWLSDYIGFPVRLARYAGAAGTPAPPASDPQRRAVDPEWAPPGSSTETAFSDGFPFLLANEASLEDLNSQLAYRGEPELPMNRFRPNFVVSGARAWAEDRWRCLAIGEGDGAVEFESVKPCSRCKVTTIDQATGQEGLEPLPTLREARSGRALGWDAPADFRGSVFFATNLVARGRGVVRVGDPVRVTEERPRGEQWQLHARAAQ